MTLLLTFVTGLILGQINIAGRGAGGCRIVDGAWGGKTVSVDQLSIEVRIPM